MEAIDIFHSYNLEYTDWDALFCMDLDPVAVRQYCQVKRQLRDHPETAPDPPDWEQLLKTVKTGIP